MSDSSTNPSALLLHVDWPRNFGTQHDQGGYACGCHHGRGADQRHPAAMITEGGGRRFGKMHGYGPRLRFQKPTLLGCPGCDSQARTMSSLGSPDADAPGKGAAVSKTVDAERVCAPCSTTCRSATLPRFRRPTKLPCLPQVHPEFRCRPNAPRKPRRGIGAHTLLACAFGV